ncbi:large ribosomal subunit protein uL3 [Candidatus Vidania fulgoroideorum]
MKYNYFAFKGYTSSLFIMGKHIQVTEIKFSNSFSSNYSLICYIKHYSKRIPTLGSFVNITSVSKGRGFCGVIKRHGFSSGNKSHGNSKSHNKPGSIGMCQDPGRVFKGKKMPGHKGFSKSHFVNLRVFLLDFDRILIKGCIPGSVGSRVFFKS